MAIPEGYATSSTEGDGTSLLCGGVVLTEFVDIEVPKYRKMVLDIYMALIRALEKEKFIDVMKQDMGRLCLFKTINGKETKARPHFLTGQINGKENVILFSIFLDQDNPLLPKADMIQFIGNWFAENTHKYLDNHQANVENVLEVDHPAIAK